MALAAVVTLGAYLIGTISFADLASRLAHGGTRNVRTAGSGNPGALNTASVLGKKWGLVVLLADFGKGVVAARLGHAIAGDTGMALAAVAVVLGHCAPIWSRFAGGKGIATTGGALVAMFPLGAPFVVASLAAAMVVTRSTSRAAYGSVAVLVVTATVWAIGRYSDAWGIPGSGILLAASIAIAAAVAIRFVLGDRLGTTGSEHP